MNYRLQRQKSGALAVHSERFAETMHPGAGPWAEATALYVRGSGLAQRLGRGDAEPLVLFDVGLGAAANALAAVACHADLHRRGDRPRPLHLVSFEADPAGARFALEQAGALDYPRGHESMLTELLEAGRAERPGLVWELRVGDFRATIQNEPLRAEVVFFDPFSPRANPELWSLATLESLFQSRPRADAQRLVTYSTAFGARAAMLLAGYFVGEGPADGGRGTVADTSFAALDQPLTTSWLARWRRDREPWPPLTPAVRHRALREALVEHPQWEHFGKQVVEPSPRGGKHPSQRHRAHRGRRPHAAPDAVTPSDTERPSRPGSPRPRRGRSSRRRP